MSEAGLEWRREIAKAQLDIAIDVLSAWRGRYEDDDWHAGIRWITAVIPEVERKDGCRSGWLCVGDTGTPGVWWRHDSVFRVGSVCRSLRGKPFVDITRRDFRAAVRASGCSLPARHATLYLDELRDPCPTGLEYEMQLLPGVRRCYACCGLHRPAALEAR